MWWRSEGAVAPPSNEAFGRSAAPGWSPAVGARGCLRRVRLVSVETLMFPDKSDYRGHVLRCQPGYGLHGSEVPVVRRAPPYDRREKGTVWVVVGLIHD